MTYFGLLMQVKVASDAQQEHADKLTHSEWGAPYLTMEQYFEREKDLYATEFAETAMTAYVLVPTTAPNTLDFLAYLEVFKRPCLYTGTRTYGYSIDAVFTPVHHRRKGYAATLLQRIVELFHDHDGVVISNLYSDIGPRFYSDKGWKVNSADELVLPSTHVIPPDEPPAVHLLPVESALDRVCRDDLMYMEQATKTGSPSVYFLLTPSLVQWFQVRSHFNARTKTAFPSPPRSLGVYLLDHEVEKNSTMMGVATEYMVWTHDFEYSELTILRCRVSEAHGRAFVRAAVAQAAEWSLASVCLWNPEHWLAAAFSEFVTTRTDDLPSLLVREGVDDKHHVTWFGNEKYCWV
ncbi:hypothetical protein DYB30_004068 [Aphanomyces astaci]|uniref:LYC1 C-terminal domain-containing protein n=1 Tax=Aphanomyces astaci TaxID=112090 RepID=A0A397F8T2_APHAT|nr:hypothetical protein DYB30_004068 [Aphanomyces astaci]RHY81228.1 hypothetical protein DYB26_005732 [Aphanomyces astaci]RHZ19009.1 hypothetical protein DYB31_004842 [Aphanomyces astaci]